MTKKPGKPEIDPEREQEMVEQRVETFTLLHKLLVLSRERSLKNHPAEFAVLGLVVGAAFSLWRAVPLIPFSEREVIDDEAGHITDLLQYLVHDNAVNYVQEKNTSAWMAGYYLNNARYRLR